MRTFLVRALALAAWAGVVVGGSAQAADMATKAPPLAPPLAYSWAGFYVGGEAGWAWSHIQHCDTPAFCSPFFNSDGFVGGGTAGYNWQLPNLVAGLETDFSGASVKGTTTTTPAFGCGAPAICYTKMDWFGTVRGRIGPSYDNWFLYLTGGYAYGEIKAGLGSSSPPFGVAASATESGWTLGAGIEYGLPAKNWSVKLEYLYLDFRNLFYDTAHICGNLDCTSVHDQFNVLRLGLNYRF
jgi:outer membrane immunogenic protein